MPIPTDYYKTKMTKYKCKCGKTKELSKAVMDVLKSNYGSRPHLIINNLDRKKMDANRCEPIKHTYYI